MFEYTRYPSATEMVPGLQTFCDIFIFSRNVLNVITLKGETTSNDNHGLMRANPESQVKEALLKSTFL